MNRGRSGVPETRRMLPAGRWRSIAQVILGLVLLGLVIGMWACLWLPPWS
jgi:hypothetical protein